MFKISW